MVTVEEEFKKNPNLMEEDLKHVKDWISKQPHLPQNITDEKIILLMHRCYYNIERSKQFIDTFYTLRTNLPEFFNDRDINRKDLQETFKTCNIIPLEGKTKEGYTVIYAGLGRSEAHFFEFADSFKMLAMVADVVIEAEGTGPGMIIVIDFNDVKLGHLTRLSLSVMRKLLTYVQEGTPARLEGLHFINVVPLIDKLIAMMRPFMKKELMDKLVLHSQGSDTIYDIVPKHILPNECGGTAGFINDLRVKTYQLMEEHQEWYKYDELMRVDEAKRPGKAASAKNSFGFDGVFKKLDSD